MGMIRFYHRPNPRSRQPGAEIGRLHITDAQRTFVFHANADDVIRTMRDNMTRMIVLSDVGSAYTGREFLRVAGLLHLYVVDKPAQAPRPVRAARALPAGWDII
jgi:hypothetical protein